MSVYARKNPAQKSKALFVKTPAGIKSHGKWYSKGDYYNWEELGVEWEKVVQLYNQGLIHHNDDLETRMVKPVGDGLEQLNIDQLHTLRTQINEKVKKVVSTATEYNKKKCGFSKIPDKQRGKIRSWRRVYGDAVESAYEELLKNRI